MARLRIAVDTGGTFTDVFIFNEKTGKIHIQKVPSIPEDPSLAVVNGLEMAEVKMYETVFFSHGTTVGTNALITRRLPLAGMISTKGFRDVIEIRRSTKPDLWDHYKDVAPPYIPRRHRLEVDERIDYKGTVLTPLNEKEARHLADVFKKRGMESVAICFMNSYINGKNEQQMKEIIQEELPNVNVCTSSELLPDIFEHERFSTCVINAVLGPVVGKYLKELVGKLENLGYKGDILVLHSGGGVMKAETVAKYASRIASSGIAAGAIAMNHTARLCGFKNAMGLDMGGTSCDISLNYNGNLRMSKEWQVEYGYPIMYPSIEVITIGAGGGSIAWVDEGGSLRNGPQSAGANPGPACYQDGGDDPTNTDANLILGRLDSELLAGRMKLSKEAAEKAVQKIATKFDMTVVDAAYSIIALANANMCDGLRLLSVSKGYDPRDFALVAFGGAGPLHAAYLARELEIPTVVIPPYPGVHAATGCLLVDVRHDFSRTFLSDSKKADLRSIERVYAELEAEAKAMLSKENINEDQVNTVRYMDLRYTGQWRSLSVETPNPFGTIDHVLEIFHTEHEREFAWSNIEQGVEIYGLRVTAIGKVPKPTFAKGIINSKASAEPRKTRKVYFDKNSGFVDTPIFNRTNLPPGLTLAGPAIIEQLDTTTVIPPNIKAIVDEYYNILMYIRS